MNGPEERNVLVALMAAQLAMISHEQMQAVLRTWIREKTQDVGEIIRRQHLINEHSLELLLALVDAHLARHGNAPYRPLGTLTAVSDSARRALAQIDDPDVRHYLTAMEQQRSATVVGYDQALDDGDYQISRDIPRFSIIRRHAVGGLGEVFVAFDHELNRQVALKEIRSEHAYDAGSRQRFVLEAEITGGLEHPGIVPVYGLGAHNDGRPYYAMRFIKGSSLAEAADAFHRQHSHAGPGDYRSSEFRKLLKRFTDVCYSMEYAHSRGVLHRDLKPGNIMLGKYGETLIVDWGLAKTIDRRGDAATAVDEETLRPSSGSGSSNTRIGQAVGTPAYMSPEAAAGQLDRIDVPSDIYCLGATLYYLLAGLPPHRSNSDDKLDSNRTGQFAPPRQSSPAIPKPLEAICLHAMRLDPAERYPNARALAEEIEHWLADEPVAAFPDPVAVRFGRFVRRHRALMTSAAAIGLLSLFGLASFALFVNSKNRELQAAKFAADANAREAGRQQRLAAANAATARGMALNIVDIAERQLSAIGGQEGFRESLMDRAYAMFRDMSDENPADDDISRDRARVARLTGNVKAKLRKFDDARHLLDESIAIQLGLKRDTASLDYVAETYRDLASLGKSSGDLDLAADSLRKAAFLIDDSLKINPAHQNLRRTAASFDVERIGLYLDLLNNEAALGTAIRAEEFYLAQIAGGQPNETDFSIATLTTSRRAQVLALLQRVDEARTVYDAGIERGREWLKRNPDRNMRFAFARLLEFYASDLSQLSPIPADAEAISREAMDLFQDIVQTDDRATCRFQLGNAIRTQAVVDQAQGRTAEANAGFEKAIELHTTIVNEAETPISLSGLARTCFLSARFHEATGEADQAVRLYQRAVACQKRAAALSPSSLLERKLLIEYEQRLNAMQQL